MRWPPFPVLLVLALLPALQGCRAAHEAAVVQRLLDAHLPVNNEELAAMAAEEEANFPPKWSLIAGGRTAVVVAPEGPGFSFGGQVGVRFWASYFLVPGVAVEVENVLQRNRSFVTLAPQVRLELTMWLDENAGFLNLPNVSFLMGVAPVIAFGGQTAVGARGFIGMHLGHLGRFLTPFFFEFGYQALVVDRIGLSGLRVALGVGL